MVYSPKGLAVIVAGCMLGGCMYPVKPEANLTNYDLRKRLDASYVYSVYDYNLDEDLCADGEFYDIITGECLIRQPSQGRVAGWMLREVRGNIKENKYEGNWLYDFAVWTERAESYVDRITRDIRLPWGFELDIGTKGDGIGFNVSKEVQ